MEEGQGARKSDKTSGKHRTRKSEEIATTPARELKGKGAVTPGDQPINEREQQSSKKIREEQKQTMDHYFFGGGKGSAAVQRGNPSPVNSSLTHCKDTGARNRNRQHR